MNWSNKYQIYIFVELLTISICLWVMWSYLYCLLLPLRLTFGYASLLPFITFVSKLSPCICISCHVSVCNRSFLAKRLDWYNSRQILLLCLWGYINVCIILKYICIYKHLHVYICTYTIMPHLIKSLEPVTTWPDISRALSRIWCQFFFFFFFSSRWWWWWLWRIWSAFGYVGHSSMSTRYSVFIVSYVLVDLSFFEVKNFICYLWWMH